ncbi:FliM/FliN family flagellar motor switch protein [Parvibaculum sp.]|uniref:FliM/FliN family flagellar motor switch protein n=1 Tax=Parvibaculum sp. TaxID=2024848 RepID=UPI001B22831F|nr:FliM/FliN family flagellar motor switch protein [Parvibaculum sp.]MBO6635846.1 flagellar motor switch protein FliN [Parvibaculum sp.]MBO6680107.1 flagellar motor switch protein FliN [Parvibaculum sp.]MBO6686161.1 flagellar motor switch protein FliN [Parvibaculum sp.]MBO6904320.1 flagellar motor switch protein FliN [Parvibaculum sp.]
MNSVNNVFVELSVVLGKTTLPIHQLLKMGRGAVIELGTKQDDEIWVLANNVPIARGEIIVQGERVAVSITSVVSAGEADSQHL